MSEKAAKGTEKLDGAKPKPKGESAPKPKASGKAKRQVYHIIVRPLSDGSNHHEVVYKGKGGMPDPQSDEFSTASPQDAGAHVSQMLGGGGDTGTDADPAASAPDPGAGAGL